MADDFTFAGMLRVWPTDIDTPAQATPFAEDYTHPMPIGVDVGQLVQTDPGDFNNDGYSESRGRVSELSGNRVQQAAVYGTLAAPALEYNLTV
jgi:hypothetical protein